MLSNKIVSAQTCVESARSRDYIDDSDSACAVAALRRRQYGSSPDTCAVLKVRLRRLNISGMSRTDNSGDLELASKFVINLTR
jgi:hypothetical protein